MDNLPPHLEYNNQRPLSLLRGRLYDIIYGTETPAGRFFDVLLLWTIILSVLAVMFDSVGYMRTQFGPHLRRVEWGFTALFSVEYLFRLASVRRPWRYALSFFGVVDILAVLPSYLSLFVPGAQSLLVVRALRLLRVFRVFKMGRYIGEARILITALQASRAKITVFVGTVLTLIVIIGTVMYLVEGESNGFTSIPQSIYWAIVTMTTVGYGDLTPSTVLGKTIASGVMIMGYGIIAVPTGIVTAEMTRATAPPVRSPCPQCSFSNHDRDARFCKQCGSALVDIS